MWGVNKVCVAKCVERSHGWQYTVSPGVEHSGEGINGCHSHNAKLFVWTEHSGIW